MDPTTFTNNFSEPISNLEPRFATIQLSEVHEIAFSMNWHMMNLKSVMPLLFRFLISQSHHQHFQPPAMLRASETQSEQDSTEIDITRMLIKSYYDIVRKNIQDAVPKAIMHFLVIFVHLYVKG